ncbi:Uncharacterized GMC-type oxidoreductase in thcA 5'region [Geodia barretti]|uniref:Uncharacterized GMC-type oxidoreductase in thcA 5'region n=1 Tax=Geodia barretti TaxID=519541 RepID=A0AA35TF01_GEOBA|nr:Uncharacterized GMC-type oxidoreductase in thcA 5'region [Geodia barretti]
MKYDVVIVGGGAAGSVLASRLAEDTNMSVLLLEAGKDYPDPENLPDEIKYGGTRFAESPDSEHNWALRGTITEEQGEIHVAQGKVIGGGSSINGQAMQRGLPEDFDDWSARGNTEWSYDKVLPFYRKMERDLDIHDDFHGTDGPIPVRRRQSAAPSTIQKAFLDACMKDGYPAVEDTNGPNPTGVGVAPTNNLGGVRMSAALAHLSPMRHRLNLTVRGEVYVQKVLFEGRKAVGVEAISGGEVFQVFADRVVLSAGSIRSPQLLMLSGIGPGTSWNSLASVLRKRRAWDQSLFNHLSAHINYKLALHFGRFGRRNDMLLRTNNVVDEREERVRGIRTRYHTSDVPPERSARLSCTLGRPKGTGFVRLASADASVQPTFNYQYLQHPDDIRRVREGIRMGARLLESDAYKDVIDYRISPTDEILNNDDALDLWIRQTVGTARHVSGTCKMGPDSDPMTVVDQHCRVKGVEGLWVADASVCPHIPRSGGLHPTALMIGERVVDWVAAG